MVEKPAANAGERSHFPIQEDPPASEQLSPCAIATEPVLWSPGDSPSEPDAATTEARVP